MAQSPKIGQIEATDGAVPAGISGSGEVAQPQPSVAQPPHPEEPPPLRELDPPAPHVPSNAQFPPQLQQHQQRQQPYPYSPDFSGHYYSYPASPYILPPYSGYPPLAYGPAPAYPPPASYPVHYGQPILTASPRVYDAESSHLALAQSQVQGSSPQRQPLQRPKQSSRASIAHVEDSHPPPQTDLDDSHGGSVTVGEQQQQNQQNQQKQQGQQNQKQQENQQNQQGQQGKQQSAQQQAQENQKEIDRKQAQDLLEEYQENEEPKKLLNYMPKKIDDRPVLKDW